MKEFSKREFTELLESAHDEELEFMAEAIVSTQKERHGWRRWIQLDRIWLVLLTPLWIYPWVVGISVDGDLALAGPLFDLLSVVVNDQELFFVCMDLEFLAAIEDSDPETLGLLFVLLFGLFGGLLIAWGIFFVWVPIQWFRLALRFFQRYRITIHARER